MKPLPGRPDPGKVPVQIRLPDLDAQAFKLAALNAKMTLSDWMLAAGRAHLKDR